MADISKITLPSGSTYNIKDSWSREMIGELSSVIEGGVHFLGTTTTQLSDLDTTNPITIGGESVTAVAGDMVICRKSLVSGEEDVEFIFGKDGKWYEFGTPGQFKELAFANSVSGSTSYTPAGELTGLNFSGDALTATGSYTPAGTVTLTGSSDLKTTVAPGTGDATYTPAGTVSAEFSGDALTATGSYTPAGTVAAPTISLASAGATDTIHNPTSKTVITAMTDGALPSCTMPVYVAPQCTMPTYTAPSCTMPVYVAPQCTMPTYTAPSCTMPECELPGLSTEVGGDEGETLILSWSAGSYTDGSYTDGSYTDGSYTDGSYTDGSYTAGSYVDGSYTAGSYTDGSFDPGTLPTHETGDSIDTTDVTVKTGDAEYEADAPAFTGTDATISASATPAGSIVNAAFTGTGVHLETGSITVPDGATFAGTDATISASATPAGSVTGGFSGTSATITITSTKAS